MQGKGIVKFFLAALAVVSLLQFIYIFPTNSVEKKAESYAESRCANSDDDSCLKTYKAAYLDSTSNDKIFSIPLFGSFTYQELKSKQLNFGLDLKGGMSVLMQVDLEGFIDAMAEGYSDKEKLNAVLARANEMEMNAQSNYINLFTEAWKEIAPGEPLATAFKRNETLADEVNADTPDSEMTRILREKADETVDLTFKLLKERIDKMGVIGPNISLDAQRDLITVELPGVENRERAVNYLQAAAKLEFWNVYTVNDGEVYNAFVKANELLEKSSGSSSSTSTTSVDEDNTNPADSTGTVASNDSLNTEDPTASLNALSSGPLFEKLTLTQGTFARTVFGRANKNQIDDVNEMLNRPEVRALFPREAIFVWSRSEAVDFNPEDRSETPIAGVYELSVLRKERGSDTAPLEGDRVTRAEAIPDSDKGGWSISLTMDSQGAQTWGRMTTDAVNDINNPNRPIAIVLDSQLVSAPNVINPILDGRSSITGNYGVQEAKDLANILQIGKLPATTKIIQEALVGPSLGQQNIDTSMNAMAFGFLLVLAFMIFYYGGAGLVSIVVLFLNVVFMVAAVASFGTVLTLPGIAGIVLTIGMAVDANVIIYERVREELRAGKSPVVAMKDGFKHSYSAIIDGNVTTFLVAMVLNFFGLGPIKGFAVVLMIGILSTLFTAVLVSRYIFEWWFGKGNTITFWRDSTKNVLANVTVDWMARRKQFYLLSGAIIVAGMVSMFTRGFDLGVDFRGGYSVNVEFASDSNASADAIRDALTAKLEKTPTVKAAGNSNTFNIVTDYLVDDTADDAPERVVEALHGGLASFNPGELSTFKSPDAKNATHVTSMSKVGPTVADDLRDSAWEAIIFGLLVIFLYILVRFRRWQYSLGAVIATTHDALVVVSLFSLLHGLLPFPMEVDQAFIAAILTIIGYSVNDTVIVYDRIREYFGLYPDKEKNEVINMAINSTMSRTVITGITTLFTVFVLWLFGSGSIKGFAFALVIGVIVGTYSSIFIASPVMSDLSKADIRITNKESNDKKGGRRSFKRRATTEKA